MLFPTSLVGSYPQPDWLIDRARLAGRFPPRVRALELWRVEPAYLQEAQRDATVLPIRAQEQAGLDILTDGEARRESYSNRFATALDGVDIDNPGTALDRSGHPNPVPRVTGPVRRRHGVKVINRALEGATGTTAVHLCFGYAAIIHDRPAGYSFLPELAACACDQISIETAQSGLDCEVLSTLDGKTVILGVLDLNDLTVETPDVIVERVRRALPYVPAERLVLAPDCGMKYLPRDVAFGKLSAMTQAATRLRAELGS